MSAVSANHVRSQQVLRAKITAARTGVGNVVVVMGSRALCDALSQKDYDKYVQLDNITGEVRTFNGCRVIVAADLDVFEVVVNI